MKLLIAFTLAILIASVVCPPPITTTKRATTQPSSGGALGEVGELTSTPIETSSIPSSPFTTDLISTTNLIMTSPETETTTQPIGGQGSIVGLIMMLLNNLKNLIDAILSVFSSIFGM
jgi:hypothetical protein